MVKPTALSKSVWAQLGLGVRSRDTEFPSAPDRVSEDAQARNNIDKTTARLVEFSPRKQNQLPERPSTSAGPASSFAKRKNAEKRKTKDDLHFNPLGAHGKGTTFYNFPLPGSLPTPATTPRSSPPPPRKSSLRRPSTPESIEIAVVSATMAVPQTEIGMALGSPAHPPVSWQQGPVDIYDESHSPDHMDGSGDDFVNSPPMLKPKSSRWKLLGGLFGGAKKNPSAFYQLQPETTHQTVVEADPINFEEPPNLSEKKPPKSRGRGRTNSERKTGKSKLNLKRAETAPLNFNFQDAEARNMHPATPEITLEGGPLADNHQSSYKGLDVDIPSVHMERYSVMFGSILQKSPGTSNSSSLLARRQATLDKLKTVNEALALKEQDLEARAKQIRPRRATSPQPTKSPAFSLFPSTPSRARAGSPSGLRTPNLQRSNTSPAALSPSRPSFAPSSENEAHARVMSGALSAVLPIEVSFAKQDSAFTPRIVTLKSEKAKAAPKPSVTASPKPPQWSTEESHLALDSSSDAEADDLEQEDTYDPAPFPMKPELAEPHWQMINTPHNHVPGPSTAGSSTSRSDHSASTSASSITTSQSASSLQQPLPKQVHIQSPLPTTRSRSATATATISPRPRRDPSTSSATVSREDEELEARLKSAADVSIARQISISRQQRQLLVPIKGSLKTPLPTANVMRRLNAGERPVGISGQNFPTPGGGLAAVSASGQTMDFPVPATGIGAIGMGRVASPLGAVAVAAQEERERAGSPLGDRVVVKEKKERNERLVEGVKPSTPMLVVVGGGLGDWGGATAKDNPIGLAEHRMRKNSGNEHGQRHEITIGLQVGPGRDKDLANRKSERVVVERVSVASN